MSKYGVMSGLYFPVFGLNTEIYLVNLRIQSEYRKIRTRNNSVFGHFSRSVTALPLMDTFNLSNTEIADILSGTVYSKLLVNLKTSDRSGVKSSDTNNTNITDTPTSFNKFRLPENGKTDSKITESIYIRFSHLNRAYSLFLAYHS